MGWDTYTRAVLSLLVVLGLVVLATYLLRLYGARALGQRGARRLKVVEVTALDPRRRLVLVRRDTTEHLLLLAPNRDLVIETGIVPPASFEAEMKREAPP